MQRYKYLKLITCLLVLIFTLSLPVDAFADEAQVGEHAGKTDCSQCDKMCEESVDGESLESLNNWICKQCLELCEEQNTPDEPLEDMGSSPCSLPTT